MAAQEVDFSTKVGFAIEPHLYEQKEAQVGFLKIYNVFEWDKDMFEVIGNK